MPPCLPSHLQSLMEKAVVLGVGVNRQSASEALSGEHAEGREGSRHMISIGSVCCMCMSPCLAVR